MTIRVLDNEWKFNRNGERWEPFTKLKMSDGSVVEVSDINKLTVSGCDTITKSHGKWYSGKHEVQPYIEIIGETYYLFATLC